MRSAHIRHHRGAVCPFTPARATGSISLNRGSAASAADLTPIPGSSRGERWSATRRPGRWALKRRPRTGGRMPPSSRTGMFGAGSRVCFMPGGPGRARRRWCAARAPWTFVTRSVWWRSPGNQLGPRARSGDFPLRRSGSALASTSVRVKSRQVSCAMFGIQVCTTNHIQAS